MNISIYLYYLYYINIIYINILFILYKYKEGKCLLAQAFSLCFLVTTDELFVCSAYPHAIKLLKAMNPNKSLFL